MSIKLQFPEGYKPDLGEAETMTINGVTFTLDEFDRLVQRGVAESTTNHARRLADALRLGCVTKYIRRHKESTQ